MAIRILMSEKTQHRNIPTVAISSKLRRLTLNKEAFLLLSSKYGSEFEYFQILVDDDEKGVFYIKPCEKEGPGSKKLDSPSPGTRTCHVSMLLKEFNWSIKDTARFEVEWDEKVQAGKVDTRQEVNPKQ
jgi:hypothetical protein